MKFAVVQVNGVDQEFTRDELEALLKQCSNAELTMLALHWADAIAQLKSDLRVVTEYPGTGIRA